MACVCSFDIMMIKDPGWGNLVDHCGPAQTLRILTSALNKVFVRYHFSVIVSAAVETSIILSSLSTEFHNVTDIADISV